MKSLSSSAFPQQWLRGCTLVGFLALSLVPGASYGQGLGDGLISYWPMDDGLADPSTLIAADLKATNPMQLTSPDASAAWVSGADAKFRGSLCIDGLDTFGQVPPSPSLDIGTDAVSIALWVKLRDLPVDLTTGFSGIYDSRGDAYVLYLDKGTDELRFKVAAAGGAERPGISSLDLKVDEWLHVAGVYDGATGESRIYLNGVEKDLHGGPTGVVNTGQLGGLGRNGDEDASYFRGCVDELAIWNRALSAAEVMEVMNDGLRDSDGDGLLDSWELQYFGDLSKSASDNEDGDTLNNGEEFAAGTNPTKADTDDDTYADGFELRDGGDPLDPLVIPRLAEMGVEAGLVSFWRFDDAQRTPDTTRIQDITGNNHLQLVSPDPASAWLSGTDAKYDGSLRVDGTGTYVPVPNSQSLDIGTEAVSIAMWVQLDQLPSELANGISSIYDSEDDAYVLYLDKGNNELRFKVSATGAERPGIPAADLVKGEWIHVIGVYDGAAGSASIYLNGILADTRDGVTGPVKTGQTAAIGRDGSGGGSAFSGQVDDIGIWNVALSGPQITAVYLGTAGGDNDSDRDGLPDGWEIEHFGNLDRDGTGDFDLDGLIDSDEFVRGTNPTLVDTDNDGASDGREVAVGTDPLDPLSTPRPEGTGLAAGLISYWRFDDGLTDPNTTEVFDEILTNPLTLTAFAPADAWLGKSDAVFGGALKVDGLDNYIVVPSSPTLDIGGDKVTVATWVKLEVLPSALAAGFSGIYDSANDAYVIYLDRGNAELRFKVTATGAERPGIPESELTVGEWIHIAGVYDGSISESKIYLNGALMDTHAGPTGDIISGQIAGIGRDGDQPNNLFSGNVDDLAIWNRALTAEEIAAIAMGESILPDSSLFQITDIIYAANAVSLTWTSSIRDSYRIERSLDLNSFIELEDNVQGTEGTTSFVDSEPPAGRAYYRVIRQ